MDEPQNLDPMVKWRLQVLKFMYRDWQPHKETRNLQGVMAAYRSGNLKVEAGKVTVWYGGVKESGPSPEDDIYSEVFDDKLSMWKSEHGPDRIWVENVCSLRCPSAQVRESNII